MFGRADRRRREKRGAACHPDDLGFLYPNHDYVLHGRGRLRSRGEALLLGQHWDVGILVVHKKQILGETPSR